MFINFLISSVIVRFIVFMSVPVFVIMIVSFTLSPCLKETKSISLSISNSFSIIFVVALPPSIIGVIPTGVSSAE